MHFIAQSYGEKHKLLITTHCACSELIKTHLDVLQQYIYDEVYFSMGVFIMCPAIGFLMKCPIHFFALILFLHLTSKLTSIFIKDIEIGRAHV